MDHDGGAEMIKAAITTLFKCGFPKEDLPPLLADFTFITAFAAAGATGVTAMLDRIRERMKSAQSASRFAAVDQNSAPINERAAKAAGQVFDGSPIRIAMEHLISHQGVPLDQAAACFTIYAVMLVFDRLGAGRARAVVNTTERELRRLTDEAGLRPPGSVTGA